MQMKGCDGVNNENTIRRTGSYALPQAQHLTPAQLIAAQAQLLVDMEKRMDEVQGQTRALEATVDTAMKALTAAPPRTMALRYG